MRNLILFLTFLTGFSGLVFQVAWQKYFSYFLGGEALSSALVVSIFLGGLSVGYAWFGVLAKNKTTAQLIKLAGWAELGIGVWAFLFPYLFGVLWNNMDLLPASGFFRHTLDILITIFLLSPATILMGSTLPLLTRGLTIEKQELSWVHSRLYGINTLGAFLGSIFTGFILIKLFGLQHTLTGLSTFNILSGAVLTWWAGKLPSQSSQQQAFQQLETTVKTPVLVLALSFLSGFVAIGFETVFMRSVSLAVGTSEYSYSLVVGVFVLMIATGTLSLGFKRSTSGGRLFANQVWLTLGLVFVFLTIPYWGWLNYVVRASLVNIPSNFYIYYAVIFLTFSLVIAIPVFFMGRTMPLLFSALDSTIGAAAQNVGRIYAANTIGCCLGGVIMGYILFLNFDADWVFRFGILLSSLGLALILALSQFPAKLKYAMWAITAILIAGSLSLPHWARGNMTAGLFRIRTMIPVAFSHPQLFLDQFSNGRKVLFYRDDPNTNVAVVELANGSRSLYVNGKSDGSTSKSDLTTTLLLGHLPGLFSKADGPAAIVGLGLGTTAQTISKYGHITHVDAFEIADAVIAAQPLFASVNENVTSNPKVTIKQMDAFRGLLSSPAQYAAVISEPSNPWVSGVDRLYSEEFYKAVKQKMLAGGVFAQWMHTYEMSFDTFGIVMRTFSQAFPNIRIFYNSSDLILLGSDKPWDEESWRMAEARWTAMNLGKQLEVFGLKNFADLALHESAYPAQLAAKYPSHSLFTPRLSFAAAKDFFLGGSFDLNDIGASDPLFALSQRQHWDQSFMFRSAGRNPAFATRLVENCGQVEGNTARFVFKDLNSYCKSRLLFMAAARVLPPPPDQKIFFDMVGLMNAIHSPGEIKSPLPVAAQRDFLRVYPTGVQRPPLRYLASLAQQCGQDTDCVADVTRLHLRFGYISEAAQWFTALSTVNGRQADNAVLMRQIEQASTLR